MPAVEEVFQRQVGGVVADGAGHGVLRDGRHAGQQGVQGHAVIRAGTSRFDYSVTLLR